MFSKEIHPLPDRFPHLVHCLQNDPLFFSPPLILIPPHFRSTLINTIAQTVADCESLTGQPITYVELLPGGNETDDDAYADDDGHIELYVDFLAQTAHQLASPNPISRLRAQNYFRHQIAHEVYHIREARLFPKLWARGTTQTDRPWIADRGEYAAEIFAFTYLSLRQPQGVLDRLLQKYGNLEASRTVDRYRQLRRHHKF